LFATVFEAGELFLECVDVFDIANSNVNSKIGDKGEGVTYIHADHADHASTSADHISDLKFQI